MRLLNHPSLHHNPSPATQWGPADKPVLIVDGVPYGLRQLSEKVSGLSAYVVGARERDLPRLATFLDAEYLHFYELPANDLAALALIARLRHLKIHWNTKLETLDHIGSLGKLETLVLIDTPKIKDLSPLTRLAKLAALEFSGGIWNKNHAESLEPIAMIPGLEELVLTNLRVGEGGLRPLANCKALRRLGLSNQFETADYAFLSVTLRQVECDYFSPWVRVELPNGNDTMIIGKRKFLNSKLDVEKIAAFEQQFRLLQAQFSTAPSF